MTTKHTPGTFAIGEAVHCNWCGQPVNDPVRAAAPELLESAKDLVAVLTLRAENGLSPIEASMLVSARAAISKATGQQ